jgi:hypothetical protein
MTGDKNPFVRMVIESTSELVSALASDSVEHEGRKDRGEHLLLACFQRGYHWLCDCFVMSPYLNYVLISMLLLYARISTFLIICNIHVTFGHNVRPRNCPRMYSEPIGIYMMSF